MHEQTGLPLSRILIKPVRLAVKQGNNEDPSVRRITIALAGVLLITGCVASEPGQSSVEAPPAAAPVSESSSASQSSEQVLDFALCRAGLRATQTWASDLIIIGAAYSAVVDLSGPGLIDLNLQDPRAPQANSDLFDALQFLSQKVGAIESTATAAFDGANACTASPAFSTLPTTCQQALSSAASPEGTRLSTWVGAQMAFLDAMVDALQASAANGFRIPPRQRDAFRSAERTATASARTMSAEAAEINRLASRCSIPAS
jgi:hypothetical protein